MHASSTFVEGIQAFDHIHDRGGIVNGWPEVLEGDLKSSLDFWRLIWRIEHGIRVGILQHFEKCRSKLLAEVDSFLHKG